MKVSATLCNHVEALNNLLYVSGGGIDRSIVPPGAPSPYGVTLGLGIIITVPWQQTNQQHKLNIGLVDADGQPVLVPTGPDVISPLKVEAEFNVGRPPGLATGEDQNVAMAVNFPGIPLPSLGRYRFLVELDGSLEEEISYQVVSLNQTMGIGPSALPRF
ncbi:DUF6941 family protein [uncultured Jatrophihabitans sp.]|uniref:DUF6941 family protein n=1 Tax=uncultured Jatrophihabitans sp. TaxID=1610747 RepID=UPI0035C99B2C